MQYRGNICYWDFCFFSCVLFGLGVLSSLRDQAYRCTLSTRNARKIEFEGEAVLNFFKAALNQFKSSSSKASTLSFAAMSVKADIFGTLISQMLWQNSTTFSFIDPIALPS
jgi:hypothetical protein